MSRSSSNSPRAEWLRARFVSRSIARASWSILSGELGAARGGQVLLPDAAAGRQSREGGWGGGIPGSQNGLSHRTDRTERRSGIVAAAAGRSGLPGLASPRGRIRRPAAPTRPPKCRRCGPTAKPDYGPSYNSNIVSLQSYPGSSGGAAAGLLWRVHAHVGRDRYPSRPT